jgi:hypothetical protein
MINSDTVMESLGQRSRALASVYWRMLKIGLDNGDGPGCGRGEVKPLWGGSEVL